MAYNIFLKSLRSLHEFRKNPHIKIPPKSPCINFQRPNIFKIQFLFRNDLELAAVVHALKIQRHYLIGHRCEIYSDHKSLQYILTQDDFNL
jgi:hypothetical protein